MTAVTRNGSLFLTSQYSKNRHQVFGVINAAIALKPVHVTVLHYISNLFIWLEFEKWNFVLKPADVIHLLHK